MTIIAIDHEYAVADGMKLWHNEIRGLDHKKLVVAPDPRHAGGQIIAACAGLAALQMPLIKWYQDGANPGAIPEGMKDDCGWTFVVIDRTGLWKYSHTCPYPESFDAPFAIGAGIDMALGAMYAGFTARQAVELVNARCNTSGGEIQQVSIMEVTGFTLRKPVGQGDPRKAAYIEARRQAEAMRPALSGAVYGRPK